MCLRRLLVLACAAAVLAPSASQAQLRLAPDWAETPDSERLSRRYPAIPQLLSLSGEVLLSCRVTIPTGVLRQCSVLEEKPSGLGFGAAALAMTRDFHMRPPLAPGARDPDDIVRIPIRFAPPPARTPPRLQPDARRLPAAVRLVEALDLDEAILRQAEAEARRLDAAQLPGVDKATATSAAAALRAAAPEALATWRTGAAAVLATRMSERDLATAVAFAGTPQGRAYFESFDRLADQRAAIETETRRRARAAAREAFCAGGRCETEADGASLAKPLGNEDPPEPVIFWDRRPTPDDLHRAWPLARTMDLTGIAMASCRIGPQGAPEECQLLAQTPAGLGVGEAALSLSDRYRLPAGQVTSGKVGRRVLVTTIFADLSVRGRSSYSGQAASAPRRELAGRLLAVLREHWASPAWEEPLRVESEAMAVLPADVRGAAVAALRTGYAAGDRTFQELSAEALAAELDEATLRAALAFETGDGAALRRVLAEADEELRRLAQATQAQVSEGARARFCRSFACGGGQPQSSGASSAPSTRTP
jgi:protein TonB